MAHTLTTCRDHCMRYKHRTFATLPPFDDHKDAHLVGEVSLKLHPPASRMNVFHPDPMVSGDHVWLQYARLASISLSLTPSDAQVLLACLTWSSPIVPFSLSLLAKSTFSFLGLLSLSRAILRSPPLPQSSTNTYHLFMPCSLTTPCPSMLALPFHRIPHALPPIPETAPPPAISLLGCLTANRTISCFCGYVSPPTCGAYTLTFKVVRPPLRISQNEPKTY